MLCPKCGRRNRKQAKYCSRCQAPLAAAGTPSPQTARPSDEADRGGQTPPPTAAASPVSRITRNGSMIVIDGKTVNLDAIASFEESEADGGRTRIKLLTGESLEVQVPVEALNEAVAEAARERSYVEATVRDPDEMGSGLDGGRTILDTTNDFLSWASCGGCGCTTLAVAATAVGLLTRAVLMLLVR